MAKDSISDLSREDFDAGPSSYDKIEPNLYLGNLTAATDIKWLKETKITHILTVDSCPLPRKVQVLPNLTLKFIQITDMPQEDFLVHFEDSYQFINNALAQDSSKVLVHCYFGVSRSATLVIAYIMKKYKISSDDAFEIVKAKRRFVGPNAGFIAQLKLFQDMGWTINTQDARFKLYRLQIAADKFREAKILPSNFADLIKPDPSLATKQPESTVYRCKKCRRVVASVSNLIPHSPQERQIWRYVSDRQQNLTVKQMKILEENEKLKEIDDKSSEVCMKNYFIEPLAWMPDIMHTEAGKLNCPKCETKLGSFSWVAGCQCPCGTKVAPAFYLVPSKLDWSNAVQNIVFSTQVNASIVNHVPEVNQLVVDRQLRPKNG